MHIFYLPQNPVSHNRSYRLEYNLFCTLKKMKELILLTVNTMKENLLLIILNLYLYFTKLIRNWQSK
jgi:hypothetical protein